MRRHNLHFAFVYLTPVVAVVVAIVWLLVRLFACVGIPIPTLTSYRSALLIGGVEENVVFFYFKTQHFPPHALSRAVSVK